MSQPGWNNSYYTSVTCYITHREGVGAHNPIMLCRNCLGFKTRLFIWSQTKRNIYFCHWGWKYLYSWSRYPNKAYLAFSWIQHFSCSTVWLLLSDSPESRAVTIILRVRGPDCSGVIRFLPNNGTKPINQKELIAREKVTFCMLK